MKRNFISMLFIAILLSAFLSKAEELVEENATAQLVVSENVELIVPPQTNRYQEAKAYEPTPGFEKVPVHTVYGPLGIALKTVEIALARLYILFEF
jgi:hypothetical protein